MENPKNQLATKLKDANNVLVTVSTNPTLDQLSAAIGLTLFLTRLKKHATTVFSGRIPSTLDFLKPEETIETNTDSLRDFIISLDKNKADKIRYKVEDAMVKIFVTPYRTSITEDDLVFSQGDFNVDVVVALGIQSREDIDQAIMTHGRILHDAVVATVNLSENSDLGSLNWADPQASSLCEMMVAITDLMKANSLDGQMATALLTGIVAETERFSNEKTSSHTMSASAKLLSAGANQQLVATNLQPPEDEFPQEPNSPDLPPDTEDQSNNDLPQDVIYNDDGSLRINHNIGGQATNDSANNKLKDESAVQRPAINTAPQPWTPEDHPGQSSAIAKEADEVVEQPFDNDETRINKEHRPILSEPPRNYSQNDDGIFGIPVPKETGNNESSKATETESKIITEPPRFGGQLTATGNNPNSSDFIPNPLDLPPVSMPTLDRELEPPEQDEKPKTAKVDVPPEPYTVYEPEPADQTEAKDLPPPPSINLPKAVESVGISLPPPPPIPPINDTKQKPIAPESTDKPKTGHSFVDLGDATLESIEDNHSQKEAKKADDGEKKDFKQEAAEVVAKAVSNKTLDDIEDKVDSPHLDERPDPDEVKKKRDYKQEAAEVVAKAMSNKTLDTIEAKVADPRIKDSQKKVDYEQEAVKHVAKVMSSKTLDEIEQKITSPLAKNSLKKGQIEQSPKESITALSYEPHESEPEDKVNAEKPESDKEPFGNRSSVDTAKNEGATNVKTSSQAVEDKVPSKDESSQISNKMLESVPNASTETKSGVQDEAREAVKKAIDTSTDNNPPLPPLEAVGTAGMMEVGHSESEDAENETKTTLPPSVPPPISSPSHKQKGSSPVINIDPEDGTLTPLQVDSAEGEATVADNDSPPPVPPPMMPQSLSTANSSKD